jgi:hypothetical protein
MYTIVRTFISIFHTVIQITLSHKKVIKFISVCHVLNDLCFVMPCWHFMPQSNTVFTHDQIPLQSSVSRKIPIQYTLMFQVLFVRFNVPPDLRNEKQDTNTNTNPLHSGVYDIQHKKLSWLNMWQSLLEFLHRS